MTARNETWDALAAVLGWEPERGDRAGEKRFGKAVRDLNAVAATPASIRQRAGEYRRRWPNVRLTPEAFLKHWSDLGGAGARPASAAPAPPEEDPNELARALGRTWAS